VKHEAINTRSKNFIQNEQHIHIYSKAESRSVYHVFHLLDDIQQFLIWPLDDSA